VVVFWGFIAFLVYSGIFSSSPQPTRYFFDRSAYTSKPVGENQVVVFVSVPGNDHLAFVTCCTSTMAMVIARYGDKNDYLILSQRVCSCRPICQKVPRGLRRGAKDARINQEAIKPQKTTTSAIIKDLSPACLQRIVDCEVHIPISLKNLSRNSQSSIG